MPETKSTTETKIENITVEDMDNLLGTPGAEAAMIASEGENEGETKKPSFFKTGKPDMTFLDDDTSGELTETEKEAAAAAVKAEEERVAKLTDDEKTAETVAAEAKAKAEEEAAAEAGSTDTLADILGEGDTTKKKGRPALDKAGMAQLAEALIEDKVILPFEDEDKKLEDYTLDDYKQLFQMNFESQKQQIQADTPKEFFESLPQELQYAAKYVADGGQDIKGLFSALAASEESKALSIDTPAGQERAARQFLQASSFGTDDEIQEQIDSWKDLEKLEDKAKQFKPKLDSMQDQIVQRKLKEQEQLKEQRSKSSEQYADSIFKVLEKGELAGGIKITNKVQNMLYQGLIQPTHQSASGQQTNLFGHLIEKHQFIEPNHGLIAEALWLLSDPEGYRTEIAKDAKNEANSETARKLKIAEASKSSGSGEGEDNDKPGGNKKPSGIKRQSADFFKR